MSAREPRPSDTVPSPPGAPALPDTLQGVPPRQGNTPTPTPYASGRYRPVRLHAQGGLGEVHVAEDTCLGPLQGFQKDPLNGVHECLFFLERNDGADHRAMSGRRRNHLEEWPHWPLA